jgi:hypothetical protein
VEYSIRKTQKMGGPYFEMVANRKGRRSCVKNRNKFLRRMKQKCPVSPKALG